MKRTAAILATAAMGLLLLLNSCGGSSDETFTGSVVLTDFTYNGSHTLYLSVFDRGGSDSFFYVEDSSSTIHSDSFSTTYTGTGPEDVVVADITIENPDFEVSSGLNLFLMIAEDTDDSGELNAGDLVLPFYSILLKNGETLELEGIQFNTTFSDTQPYSANPSIEHVWLNISDLLPFAVDAENAVILKVHQTINDFSNTAYYQEIVIKDRRLLGDMMLYSFGSATYYFFLHYDTDGGGTISPGDHVSYSDYTAVTGDYMADLASNSADLTLELNSYTVVP